MGAGTGFDQGSGGGSSSSSVLIFKQTITAAQMATCGSSPIVLLPNLSNKIYCVIPNTFCMKKTGGTTNGYTFNASSDSFGLSGSGIMDYYAGFDLSGTQPGFSATKLLESYTSVHIVLNNAFNGTLQIKNDSNQQVFLTTNDSANPVSGDNDIIVSFNYTIIDLS